MDKIMNDYKERARKIQAEYDEKVRESVEKFEKRNKEIWVKHERDQRKILLIAAGVLIILSILLTILGGILR